jgi:FdhD protein
MVAILKICKVTQTTPINTPAVQRAITRYGATGAAAASDLLATEEPLEIRLRWQVEGVWQEEPLTITMRTPGHDLELAAGLLYSEGIVRRREHIASLAVGDNSNSVVAVLAPGHQLDLKRYQRHFYSTSSCGVCGKMAIESLQLLYRPVLPAAVASLQPVMVQALPEKLRAAQALFAGTGGVHAAGLFSATGELLVLREDIGRHNAVDKLLGARLLADDVCMDDTVLLVSGRAGFEVVQKALAANIAVLLAVGAPTSLAVDMAQAAGMTLVGFLKKTGFNCYSGAERLRV